MLLSIIIPVFNAEHYLAGCLDSCLTQNFAAEDYEIVCVNDGSADGSLALLRQYQQAHANLVVLDESNHGVATARNHGLDAAKGDYIWFVDADDAIVPGSLQRLRQAVEVQKPDRVSFCFAEFTGAVPEYSVLQGLQRKSGTSSVWTNLFRRSFLLQNDLRFSHPELSLAEDAVFMCELRSHLHSEIRLDEILYCYRQQASSAMHARSSKEKALRTLNSYCKAASLIRDCYLSDPQHRELNAGLLLYHVHSALTMLAAMPRKQAAPYLAALKQEKLYPLRGLRYPESPVFIQKRHGLRGIFDFLVIHSATPLGYHALRLWYFFFRLHS